MALAAPIAARLRPFGGAGDRSPTRPRCRPGRLVRRGGQLDDALHTLKWEKALWNVALAALLVCVERTGRLTTRCTSPVTDRCRPGARFRLP